MPDNNIDNQHVLTLKNQNKEHYWKQKKNESRFSVPRGPRTVMMQARIEWANSTSKN